MSEKKRQKKDGQNKEKKTQAMREAISRRKDGVTTSREANTRAGSAKKK